MNGLNWSRCDRSADPRVDNDDFEKHMLKLIEVAHKSRVDKEDGVLISGLSSSDKLLKLLQKL